MVYRTHQAEPSLSILESRSSEKIADVFEPSYDSEESSRSYERRSPELDQSSQSLFDSSSFEGSESSQEEDEVASMSSDYLSDDLTDSIEGVEVASMKRDDLDDPIEGEVVEVDPVSTDLLEVKETKKTAPMSSPTTVILLQHIIDKTEDADAHEELETESRGVQNADFAHEELEKEWGTVYKCQRQTSSFFTFHRHKSTPGRSSQVVKARPSARRSLISALGMKKRKGKHHGQSSTIHYLDSREDTDPALARNKSSQQVNRRRSSQHFLASTLAKKKERVLEEEESYSSDDDDSREDTEDFTEDPDFEASIDSRCQPNGEWSRSANPASSLAPSEWSEGDSVDDQESESDSVDDQESRKSSKQVRSLSVQSLHMFKRGRSGDTKSVKSKRDGENEDTKTVKTNKGWFRLRDGEDEDTKTVKTNKSWFRLRKRKKTPKDANELKSKRSFSLFRKPSWGRRNKAATLDAPQATTPENPTMWEWFLEGFDNYCCLPLFREAEDNSSIHSDEQSQTPSEIYVHVDTSKSLYTV